MYINVQHFHAKNDLHDTNVNNNNVVVVVVVVI